MNEDTQPEYRYLQEISQMVSGTLSGEQSDQKLTN